jgi:type I restriction enzyme R subunit
MNLHKEISFEQEICAHLGAHGWLYAEADHARYDAMRALFTADAIDWVQATQPQAWQTLATNYGGRAGDTLLARLRDQLNQRGTLDVLRHGIELLGLKQPILMAQFKPRVAARAPSSSRPSRARRRSSSAPSRPSPSRSTSSTSRRWHGGGGSQ